MVAKGENHVIMRCLSLFVLSACLCAAEARAATSHAFLGTSHALGKIYIRDVSGRTVWDYPLPNPQDVWLLPNGNVLATWLHGVKEITPDKRIVWAYTVQAPNEVPNCQPLPDGRVMIGIVGECRLVEVDRQGIVRHEVKLETTEKKPHAQFRMCRKTRDGTYLVPFTAEGALREYDGDGRCVRRFPPMRSPVCALRLSNGNTLVSADGGVTEYDAQSVVVWRLDFVRDLPDVQCGIPAGIRRLANGNTLVCNWGSRAQGGKRGVSIIEVTSDKRPVWEVSSDGLEKVAQCRLLTEGPEVGDDSERGADIALLPRFAGAAGNVPPIREAPEKRLPTGRRQYVNNPALNAQAWPRSVLINHPGYERLLDGLAESPQTDNPGFGGAFSAADGGAEMAGCPALDQAPLTIRLRVKARNADAFNIFVAHGPKLALNHWEFYSFRGSGYLAFYMPGNAPDTILSRTCVTDGRWHDVAAVVARGRVRLFADGKAVAEGPVTRPFGRAAAETRLAVGSLVGGGLVCNGWLDDVCIRSAEEMIIAPLAAPQKADASTLFLCAFDAVGGRYAVAGKMAGSITAESRTERLVDELLPRADIEPTVKPGEKPPKNVPTLACTAEQFAEAVRRIGLKAVRADDVRPGVLSFWGEQAADVQRQIDGRMPLPRGAVSQVYDPQALVKPGERTPYEVVVRRTGALLDALEKRGVDVAALRADWRRLPAPSGAQSNDVFAACAVRRAAMFANPDWDAYDRLVFLARACYAGCRLTNMKNTDRTGGHFATQCFGFNTIRGGGIFSLEAWRGKTPAVKNLLEGRVVVNGPYQGRTLSDGSFYTPEVSYDGKTLYFAHCGATEHRWEWSDKTVWKLFKLDLESGRVTQLTEGPWDDFDPIELPSGRIVFISERRGGFIRCFTEGSRHRVPTFVLHSMRADGSDIYPISYYETSEWQPSVDNSGMLVYTRWDYTDREDCLGSQFWTCFPDGRDPRAPHGNYPFPWHTFADNTHGDHRYGGHSSHSDLTCADAPSGLPMTEMHIRAMPNSHRYILTAAPHHGETFGSLCVLDLRLPDDYHMSQLRRVTPYVPFPESESSARSQYEYGTAWPVSEDLFLCNRWEDLVALDRYGNEDLVCERELLPIGYDPRLRLTHPKPLRARPKPPVIPQQTAQGADFAAADTRATIGVVNVRISDQPFPEGRTPTRLRVLQAVLKSDPWMDKPFIGYGKENTPRIPLGTVPLEADGSAYFVAPAGKQFIFQVLDQNNMAIQSMRSTAFVHPGERLTCLGCHEAKNGSYAVKTEQPLAFRRKPSALEPECGPVEPISFYRLVAPIFKSRCLACHVKEGKGLQKMDYADLRDDAFYFGGGFGGSTMQKIHGGSRSIAGRFGAAASRIGRALLTEAHRKAVPEEERHRVILWLDANSLRYSTYRDTAAQERGELVWPLLDIDPAHPLANAD